MKEKNNKDSAVFSFKILCERTFSGAVFNFPYSGAHISSIKDQVCICYSRICDAAGSELRKSEVKPPGFASFALGFVLMLAPE